MTHTESKEFARCRGCGRVLHLHETQHGSHVIYNQEGTRECGAVDWIERVDDDCNWDGRYDQGGRLPMADDTLKWWKKDENPHTKA